VILVTGLNRVTPDDRDGERARVRTTPIATAALQNAAWIHVPGQKTLAGALPASHAPSGSRKPGGRRLRRCTLASGNRVLTSLRTGKAPTARTSTLVAA